MPTARQILDLLTRDELLRLADQHQVTVADRRQKALLAEGLAQQGRALSELLSDFSRDRLKELCRALGLDDSGRDKASILTRLAGAAPRSTRSSAISGRRPISCAGRSTPPITRVSSSACSS